MKSMLTSDGRRRARCHCRTSHRRPPLEAKRAQKEPVERSCREPKGEDGRHGARDVSASSFARRFRRDTNAEEPAKRPPRKAQTGVDSRRLRVRGRLSGVASAEVARVARVAASWSWVWGCAWHRLGASWHPLAPLASCPLAAALGALASKSADRCRTPTVIATCAAASAAALVAARIRPLGH